ncbi:uncharacterized protein [Gossypium hirsutum]|uniref:Uncharacterized protein n=1 Tax=Gossypium hirsutum TaxID=3635 RepID=A0A1U8LPM9_GOSHI|nr:uncharacterized protein LOC107928657 [Gossypium hirsutum]
MKIFQETGIDFFSVRHFPSPSSSRYGSVIEHFQRREGLKEMIKGVIFYSGSADPLNPKVITICISGTVQSKVSIFQILVVFVLVWSNGHLASLQHVSSISCPHLMFQRLWLSPEAIFARMEYRRCPEGVLSYIMLQSSFTSEFSRLL